MVNEQILWATIIKYLQLSLVADQRKNRTGFDNVRRAVMFYVAAKKLSEEQTRRTTEHKDKQQEAAVRPWQVLSQTVLMLKGCTNLLL